MFYNSGQYFGDKKREVFWCQEKNVAYLFSKPCMLRRKFKICEAHETITVEPILK